MAERKANSKVAGRYARVAFESALEQNALEAVRSDLLMLLDALGQVPDFMVFLDNPAVSLANKMALIQDLLASQVHPIAAKLLSLLVENSRMASFNLLVQFFETACNQHDNTATAQLITASPLPEESLERVRQALAAQFGFHRVILTPTVDPRLLGGAIVRLEDRVIDGSYNGRLGELRKQLTRA
jgi:F-type H+-transporting ATPase subunit delta